MIVLLSLLGTAFFGTLAWLLITGKAGPDTPVVKHFVIRTDESLESPEKYHRINRAAGWMNVTMALVSLSFLPLALYVMNSPRSQVYGMIAYAIVFLSWYGVTLFRLRKLNDNLDGE